MKNTQKYAAIGNGLYARVGAGKMRHSPAILLEKCGVTGSVGGRGEWVASRPYVKDQFGKWVPAKGGK